MEFKPGQRVEYTGALPGYSHSGKVGWKGIVVRVTHTQVIVWWDGETTRSERGGVFPGNLKLIEETPMQKFNALDFQDDMTGTLPAPINPEGPFYVFTVPAGVLNGFQTLQEAEAYAKQKCADYPATQGIFTGLKAFRAVNEVQEVPLG